MNDGGDAPLALDRQAMAWLDRLIDQPEAERARALSELATTAPALVARVARLLQAHADADASRAVAAPVAAALPQWPASRHAAGAQVAGWRLLRPLGEGGMSEVWLAEAADGRHKRLVALKLPLPGHAGGVPGERFARECEVLAALNHPHIAQLLDAGVAADGQPYLAMEHVDGVSITAYAQGLPRPARITLFRQVLAAVEHAHRHLVVHRDLKPGNILVTAEGQVKLLDFGIAKLLDPGIAATLTQEAGAVLTPRYAAPEQVLGQPVSTATDIYAAGLVLYELLTGRLPYGAAAGAALHAAVHAEARPPGLGRDIDTVLLTALRKAPQDRYASVERFDEDLRRLLAKEPILARRVPWHQRLALLLRRHPRLGLAGAAASLLLATSAALAWVQHRESMAQQLRGDAVRDFVFSMIADAEPAQGRSEVTGIELLDAAVARARDELQADPQLRGELLGELGRVYFQLHRPEQSVQVLDEAVALLASGRADDPALNRTRAILARSLLAVDPPRAVVVGRQAVQACSRDGPGCAQARALALYALASHESRMRRDADALAQTTQALAEAEAGYGPQSRALVQFLEAQAAAAGNAGAWDRAEAAIQRAQALASHHGVKSNQRNRLDMLQSTQDLERGRFAPARDRLGALVRRTDSGDEKAMHWRLLALAEWGLGRPEAALQAADQARIALAAQPGSMNALLAHQVWAQMASAAGRHAEAERAFDQVQQGMLAAGLAHDSESLRRLRRVQGEALLRAGRDAQALSALRSQWAELQAVPHSPREASLLRTPLGCAELLAGQPREALAHWQQVHEELASRLVPGHPWIARAALLVAMAGAGSDLPAARLAYLSTLADDSPLRRGAADCRAIL